MGRYLTKSRYKMALECPKKLYYTGKDKIYANSKLDDTFLEALAKGGFQVRELAKCYWPNGVEVSSLDYETVDAETTELLKKENVVIFEAALKFKNLFVRVDVLEKIGNTINLIEVKSKYHDPEFCRCGKEITDENRPQKYGVEEHVVGGQRTTSNTITAYNICLKMPLAPKNNPNNQLDDKQ